MIVMQGKDNGIMNDYWSETTTQPKVDEVDDWKTKTVTKNAGVYSFMAYRSLDTGDNAEDVTLECDKNYEFYWSGNDKTAEFTQHTRYGDFNLRFAANCSIELIETSAISTYVNTAILMSTLVYMSI